MRGLIIDTSSDLAILGYVQKETILSFRYLSGGKNLSKILFPNLQDFCPLKSLHYIAVGTGPGSYMGIRSAATVANTLAFALNLPLVEFPSPLAFLPKELKGSFAFVGDAKMGQLYVISGSIEDQHLPSLTPPLLISPDALHQHIEAKDVIFGENHIKPEPHLEWVAQWTYSRFTQENFSSTGSVALSYLR